MYLTLIPHEGKVFIGKVVESKELTTEQLKDIEPFVGTDDLQRQLQIAWES